MYEDTIQLLDQRRLKEALVQLQAFATKGEDWQLSTEIENLSTTYQYMLQYAAQGMNDPEQGKMYHTLLRSAYELADKTNYVVKYTKAAGYFADKFCKQRKGQVRTFKEYREELGDIRVNITMLNLSAQDDKSEQAKKQLFFRREQLLDALFDKVWASVQWTEDEYRQALELLQARELSSGDLAVVVSAATLSLLGLFDSRKFQFLLQTYQSDWEGVVTQRALIGIALVAYYHPKRLSLYPDLSAALSILGESEKVAKEMLTVQLILLLSRETEKIDKKMREEIIPQMMRNPGMANPNMKIFDIEDLEDQNPEWSKNMAQIGKDLRELSELQLEGADTYMSAFAQLKNYPFFRQAAHWFYPFDRQTPEVADLFNRHDAGKQGSLIEVLMDSPVFCNSDKYSFCLSMSSLPDSQRELLTAQLSEQNELVKESLKQMMDGVKETNHPDTARKQYIHDLYRFFKLWSFRNELHDIFKDKLDLWNCPALAPLLDTPEASKRIADHLFNKDYMEEAATLYLKLSQSEQPDAEILQKLGFTYQKMKRYPEAIEAYTRADLIKPDHVWTLKHLAQCHKRMQQYPLAIACYEKVKEMKPDDLNVLLQLGQCLATLRQYDKALAYFYKVEYLDKTPANAQRAIGWCYFMTGKYEDALRFYLKLQQGKDAQQSDWLNAGHVYLAMRKIPEALEAYRKVEAACKTHEAFIRIYLADREALLEQGVTEECISIVPDMI